MLPKEGAYASEAQGMRCPYKEWFPQNTPQNASSRILPRITPNSRQGIFGGGDDAVFDGGFDILRCDDGIDLGVIFAGDVIAAKQSILRGALHIGNDDDGGDFYIRQQQQLIQPFLQGEAGGGEIVDHDDAIPILGCIAANGAHPAIRHPAIVEIADGDAVFLIEGKGGGGRKSDA